MSSLLDINEIFDIDEEEEVEMNNSDININDELDDMLDRILDAMDGTGHVQEIVDDDNREGSSENERNERSKTYHIS
ncbi:3328_t:CDS:1, partial [Cetraspora pellucida]